MKRDLVAEWDDLYGDETRVARSGGNDHRHPIQAWIASRVERGESLLDVGCGSGVTYQALQTLDRSDVRYTGVDHVPSFVDACRETFPDGDFRVGDAHDLPLGASSVDVVLLCHVLAHTRGYEEPILEAIRVARRAVILVMFRPLRDGPDVLRTAGEVEGKLTNDYCREDFSAFLRRTAARLSLEARYEVVETRQKQYCWILELP